MKTNQEVKFGSSRARLNQSLGLVQTTVSMVQRKAQMLHSYKETLAKQMLDASNAHKAAAAVPPKVEIIVDEKFIPLYDAAIAYVSSLIGNLPLTSNQTVKGTKEFDYNGLRSLQQCSELCLKHNLLDNYANLIPAVVDYMRRIANQICITKDNYISLWGVCCCLANKFHIDTPFDNKTWAMLINMPTARLNTMELAALKLLDFELNISMDQIVTIQNQLLQTFTGENNNGIKLSI